MRHKQMLYLMVAMLAAMSLVLPASGAVNVGDTAPEFALVTTSGDTVRLSDYAGKVVLLNFFHYY